MIVKTCSNCGSLLQCIKKKKKAFSLDENEIRIWIPMGENGIFSNKDKNKIKKIISPIPTKVDHSFP